MESEVNIMKLSFKCYYKFNQLQNNIINELSYHTTKLYNIANYDCRENKYNNFYTMRELYKNNYHKQFLYSQSYQQIFKILDQNWKSYFASIKDYKKNPNKYKGEPKIPKYKNLNNKKNEIVFDKQGIRFKNNYLILSLSKEMQNKFQVQSLNFNINYIKIPNITRIKQIRLAWDNSNKRWYINFIYERNIINIAKNYNNIMSIDLGLNNLATITFGHLTRFYIIDGKYAKSKNSYYNKETTR
jgi:transposase